MAAARVGSAPQQPAASPAGTAGHETLLRATLDTYCVTCHNQRLKTAGLTLDAIDAASPHTNPEIWEKVIARLRAGTMPPAGRPRPDAAAAQSIVTWIEADIDRAWLASPMTGRVSAVHRLNRTQYSNAVRDLFALDPQAFDVTSLLPGDETADGSFDNFADVLTITTAHLERYLSAARQVTRLAVGMAPSTPALKTFEIPLHVVQDDRQDEDLPFGSRGGIAIRYQFPVDGDYSIKVRLRRQYQDYLMGMGWPQQLDVRLDGKLIKRFVVGGKAPGTPGGVELRRRRRTRLRGRARMGNLHAADRRRGPRSPRAGHRGTARGRRLVRQGAVGTGRAAATAATRPRAHQRSALHGLCGRRRGRDRRTAPRRAHRRRTPRAAGRSSSASPRPRTTPRARTASCRGWRAWPIAAP